MSDHEGLVYRNQGKSLPTNLSIVIILRVVFGRIIRWVRQSGIDPRSSPELATVFVYRRRQPKVRWILAAQGFRVTHPLLGIKLAVNVVLSALKLLRLWLAILRHYILPGPLVLSLFVLGFLWDRWSRFLRSCLG
jgi:hypothetical protein